MERRKWRYTSWKFNLFVFLVTLIYGICFTLSGFLDTPYESWQDLLVLVAQWGCVCMSVYGLLAVLSVNRWIFSVAFPILTLLCTAFAYFSYTIHVNVTPMLINLIISNMSDRATCVSVVEPQLVVTMVLSLLLSIGIVVYRWKRVRVTNWLVNLLMGIFCILVTNVWVSAFKNPVAERLPYSIYFSVKRYLDERIIISTERNTFTEPSTCRADSLTVVMVIGESMRADHFQLNGYERQTTPLLAQEANLVSLPHIYTEPTFTHTSVPHILTRADSVHTERAYTEQSFITLFKQSGFRSTWLANQESVNNYVYFMNECDSLLYVNSGKSCYVIDQWMDRDILPHYQRIVRTDEARQLLVVHTIGSHWYYTTHFDVATAPFQPNIKSKVVSSNTHEEMINSYDNTIVETDRVLHQLISELRNKKSILIYLSDHGESLGENGFYLHGTERPELHYPACFVWYSDAYQQSYPEKVQALKENKDRHYRTDFLFHSILDAAAIESSYIHQKLSVFHSSDSERF